MAAEQSSGPGDRVVLVTGATRGIGRALALRLAAPGVTLVVSGRSTAERPDKRLPGTLDEVSEQAAARGAMVVPVAADLGRPEEVDRLADAVLDRGRCDVLVNNAAISYVGPFLDTPFDRMRKVVEVDLLAPAQLCHRLLPGMLERGTGTVVNVSSGAVHNDVAPQLPYGASKAGLERVTTSLAAQYGGRGVTFTSVRIDELVVTEAVHLSAPQLVHDGAVAPEGMADAIAWMIDHPGAVDGRVLTFAELRSLGAPGLGQP